MSTFEIVVLVIYGFAGFAIVYLAVAAATILPWLLERHIDDLLENPPEPLTWHEVKWPLFLLLA